MLKKIGLVILVLIIGVLVFAATRPNTFRVERSATIKAPPDKIVAQLDDFHAWPAWSPFEKLDPNMKRTYSGPTRGPGAAYEWKGNSKAGAGRSEILQSSPSKVTMSLDFTEPMRGSDTVDFLLAPHADSTTTVTWAMYGPMNYVSKVMCLFMNMDQMVGKEFNEGLSNLKTVAEK